MPAPEGLVQRRIHEVALARHRETPVLLLEGPRTVGKFTLLRLLAAELDARLLDLDDLDTRTAVTQDPATMLGGPGPLLIDEYQRAPVVLDVIHDALERVDHAGAVHPHRLSPA